MPSWGKDNDSERHWSEKDYEALSLLYRHDVERYLNSINSYVDKDLQVQLTQTYRKAKRRKILFHFLLNKKCTVWQRSILKDQILTPHWLLSGHGSLLYSLHLGMVNLPIPKLIKDPHKLPILEP